MVITYLDLDIQIGHGLGGQYPLTVLDSAIGQARGTLHLVPGEGLLAQSLENWQRMLTGDHPPQPEMLLRDVGRQLFSALLQGEVLACYDASWKQAAETGHILRLMLRIGPQELVELPWETLFDPRLAEGVHVAPNLPVVRFSPSPRHDTLSTTTPPLRLAVIAVVTDGGLPEALQKERDCLDQATEHLQARDLLALTWLEISTWHDLRRALWRDDWQALHLLGHTELGAGEALRLSGRHGPETVGAARLGRLLASRESLRLAILTSLPTGNPKAQEAGLSGSCVATIAATLVEQGLPAAVTLPGGCARPGSTPFVRTLYEALVSGLPLDLAVTKARSSVIDESREPLAWALPALVSHAPDLLLWDRQTVVAGATRRAEQALSQDDFERAADQYALALAFGADSALKGKQTQAETIADNLDQAHATLTSLEGDLDDQSATLLALLARLETLQERVPDSQAISATVTRAHQKADDLIDRLLHEGRRWTEGRSWGLTQSRRQHRVKRGLRLLEQAEAMSTAIGSGERSTLEEDLVHARRRLEYLQTGRRGSGWGRTARLVGVGMLAALALLTSIAVALNRLDTPLFVAREPATASPASPVPSPTPRPATMQPTPTTSTSQGSLAPTQVQPTATPLPTQGPTDTLAPSSPTPLPQASNTPRPTALVQTPSATPLPSPTPPPSPQTQAPVVAEPASPSPSPSALPSPTPGIIYPAPQLQRPGNPSHLTLDRFGTHPLRWTWDGTLGEDEWFDVRIWRRGQPHYGISWTKDHEYEYDICLMGSGNYWWSVAVIRGRDGQWLGNLSEEATPFAFSTSRSDQWCQSHGRWIFGVAP